VPRVSMLEMELNTTATIEPVGLHPIHVVSYQKTRQLRDRPLIPQQIRIRRPLSSNKFPTSLLRTLPDPLATHRVSIRRPKLKIILFGSYHHE